MATARLLASAILGTAGFGVLFLGSSFVPGGLAGCVLVAGSIMLLGRGRKPKEPSEEAADLLVPTIVAIFVIACWHYRTGQWLYGRGSVLLSWTLWTGVLIGRFRGWRADRRGASAETE